MKAFLRRLLPPLLADLLRGRRQHDPVVYAGNYAHWSDAQRDSEGYDALHILERTRAALLKVRDGEAVYERDSVLFDRAEPPLQLLAGLLRAAAENDGCLHVVDFGGSLGSSWFQCRRFLAPLRKLHWSVVEQPAHVACGQRDFADAQLSFHLDLGSALAGRQPDVLLLSGVLAFLPDPHAFLDEALARRFRYVIVDRTFFHHGPRDRLTVERVPAWIYPASYPAWFLAAAPFAGHFAAHYELVADFPAIDPVELPDAPAYSRGFIYRLKS